MLWAPRFLGQHRAGPVWRFRLAVVFVSFLLRSLAWEGRGLCIDLFTIRPAAALPVSHHTTHIQKPLMFL